MSSVFDDVGLRENFVAHAAQHGMDEHGHRVVAEVTSRFDTAVHAPALENTASFEAAFPIPGCK